MNIDTFLKKHFDIEKHIEDVEGQKTDTIWVYEKGQDSEPFLILQKVSEKEWMARDVYSVLDHEKIYNVDEIKETFKKTGLVK
mgnify:CR=1 FL=1